MSMPLLSYTTKFFVHNFLSPPSSFYTFLHVLSPFIIKLSPTSSPKSFLFPSTHQPVERECEQAVEEDVEAVEHDVDEHSEGGHRRIVGVRVHRRLVETIWGVFDWGRAMGPALSSLAGTNFIDVGILKIWVKSARWASPCHRLN